MHISELAERHVEIPEQVVQVGDEILVKVIDIDLDRRRISLSLKQANEGVVGDEEQFDPAAYGMAASYDDRGQLHLPRGLRPRDRRVARGLRRRQREAWERQYAEAQARFEAHRKQIAAAKEADAEAAAGGNYSSDGGESASRPGSPAARWPATRPWPRCGPSSPAASEVIPQP